jgi:hypothetical protein
VKELPAYTVKRHDLKQVQNRKINRIIVLIPLVLLQWLHYPKRIGAFPVALLPAVPTLRCFSPIKNAHLSCVIIIVLIETLNFYIQWIAGIFTWG